jgi:hypothetical protein
MCKDTDRFFNININISNRDCILVVFESERIRQSNRVEVVHRIQPICVLCCNNRIKAVKICRHFARRKSIFGPLISNDGVRVKLGGKADEMITHLSSSVRVKNVGTVNLRVMAASQLIETRSIQGIFYRSKNRQKLQSFTH